MKLSLLLLSLFLLPTQTMAAHHDPSNPEAPVLPSIYHSEFSDYQQFKEVKENQWKAVNKSASEHGMVMDDNMKMDGMQSHDMKDMEMKGMETPANPHAGHNMQEMGKK